MSPIGAGLELVKIYDVSAIHTQLDGYMLVFPGTANLNLPDELVSVAVSMERSVGAGTYTTNFQAASGSYNLSPRGRGQGSAALMPVVKAIIKQHRADRVPTTNYLFFLPAPVSTADILAAVSATAAWPQFRPQSAVITAIGRRVSLEANADIQASDNDSGSSYSTGSGSSREVGMTIQHTNIPPTIHDTISISGLTSDTEDATASAFVELGVLSDSADETETITATVDDEGLGATSPTEIPTSGVYLFDSNCEPYRYGYVRVHAETVDFADV